MTINTILTYVTQKIKKVNISNTATSFNKVPGQHQQVAAQSSLPQSAVLPMLVTELPPQSHAPPVMLVTEPPQPLQECIDGEYAWRTNVKSAVVNQHCNSALLFYINTSAENRPPQAPNKTVTVSG